MIMMQAMLCSGALDQQAPTWQRHERRPQEARAGSEVHVHKSVYAAGEGFETKHLQRKGKNSENNNLTVQHVEGGKGRQHTQVPLVRIYYYRTHAWSFDVKADEEAFVGENRFKNNKLQRHKIINKKTHIKHVVAVQASQWERGEQAEIAQKRFQNSL